MIAVADEADGWEFRLLGPVEVRREAEQIALTGKQRALLAVLLLSANRVVTTTHIANAVWGQPLPAAPDTRVRVLVSELRRSLTGAGQELIVTRQPGYLLRVDRGQLDLDVFNSRVEQAHAVAHTDPEAAVVRYDEALALWRGTALCGVAGPFVDAHAARLEELRLRVVEQRVEAMMALGRHVELIAELGHLVTEHPLRERPHAQLMAALYRGGRRSEALEIYRGLRERLAEELGLEPTPELQRLQRQMLAGDSALDRASPAGRPQTQAPKPTRQLPADTGRFVGRRDELAELDAVSTGPDRLVLVVGAAGTGKTTLAVRWAHSVAARFPDGQLFVDMRGFEKGPRMAAEEALPQLLHALGLSAEQIPVNQEARAALYRSTLAGRRLLVVLDNVAEPEQVRPLLPGDPGCLALVTSRDRLGGLVALDGARRLTLDVLPPADALNVLAQTAGGDLVDADRQAAAELAALCGHLPLALRIAAGRIADQPHHTIRRHVEELASHGRMARLRVMGDDRASVHGAFDLSYRALPPPAQRIFRLLGLVPAPGGWSTHAASALAAVTPAEAEHLLDTLARLHLVKATAAGRYGCHDLLLEYAAELAAEDPPAERDAAVHRVLSFYLHTADHAAARFLVPPLWLPREVLADGVVPVAFANVAQASEWVAAEWDNVVAAQRLAAAEGPHPMAWQIADALRNHLYRTASRPEWLAVIETGLAAARQADDALGEASMLFCRGLLHFRLAEFQPSVEDHERSAALFRQAKWRPGESSALRSVGVSLAHLGQVRPAIDRFQQALEIDREIGDRHSEAVNLNNIASAHQELGELAESARFLTVALPLLRGIGHRLGEAVALNSLGELQHQRGLLDEAAQALDQCVAINEDLGARLEEAGALSTLGAVHRDSLRYDQAAAAFARGLDIAEQTGDLRIQVMALNGLAIMEIRLDRVADAIARLNTVLDIVARTGYHRGHVEALVALSDAYRAQGDHGLAAEHAGRALALARESGSVIAVASAQSASAAASLGLGDVELCLDHARQALDAQRRAGQRLAQARTLQTLAQANELAGQHGAAESCRQEAHALFEELGTRPA